MRYCKRSQSCAVIFNLSSFLLPCVWRTRMWSCMVTVFYSLLAPQMRQISKVSGVVCWPAAFQCCDNPLPTRGNRGVVVDGVYRLHPPVGSRACAGIRRNHRDATHPAGGGESRLKRRSRTHTRGTSRSSQRRVERREPRGGHDR